MKGKRVFKGVKGTEFARHVKNLQKKRDENPAQKSWQVIYQGAVKNLLDEIGDNAQGIEEAEKWGKELLEIASDCVCVYLYLGNLYFDSREYKKGLDILNQGLAIEKDHFRMLFDLALCYLELEEYAQAIVEFQKCLKIEPDYVWTYNNIGLCFLRLKDYQQGKKYFEKALEKKPRCQETWYSLAVLYYEDKKWIKSIEYAKKILAVDPSFVDIFPILGVCWVKLGRYDKAASIYFQTLLLNGQDDDTYSNLVFCLAELELFPLGASMAQMAIKETPENWRAYANAAFIASQQGQYEEAVSFYRQALKHFQPEDKQEQYRLFWELGWCFFKAGDYEQALLYTEKALLLKPELAILYFNKGLILIALGKEEKALKIYQKGLDVVSVEERGKISEGLEDLMEYLFLTTKEETDHVKQIITMLEKQRELRKQFLKFSDGSWGCFWNDDLATMLFWSPEEQRWGEDVEVKVPAMELLNNAVVSDEQVPQEILAQLPEWDQGE